MPINIYQTLAQYLHTLYTLWLNLAFPNGSKIINAIAAETVNIANMINA
jgi:hypothetical protein